MPRFLDPRFGTLMKAADDPDEQADFRAACRRSAEGVAAQCGYTFADALRHAGVQVSEETLSFPAMPLHDDPDVGKARDDHNVGDPDLTSEPVDLADVAAVESEPATLPVGDDGVVICHHGEDNSGDAAKGGQIKRALKADPGRSDRDIARQCDASPTTVGRVRKALGLGKTVRSVVRGGKAYAMQVGDRS